MADNLKNRDLLEEWGNVVSEYEKVTKKVLSVAAPSDPQNLEARCNELSASDRSELVKTAALSVLKVARFTVEASSIFSPAAHVFTALVYLGDTIERYRSTFTPNAALDQLKGIGTCLDRMEYYLKLAQQGIELDTRLKNIILEIFVITLRLCKTYSKVAQDSESVAGVTKNILKVAIRWDNGVEKRVKYIKELSNRELNHNVAALFASNIYEHDSKMRMANAERSKRFLKIEEVKERNWTGRQELLEKNHIPGMGDWLFQRQEFKSWVDTEHHADAPVLYVNAATGFGKTHLCAQAIWFLRNRMKTQPQQEQQKKKKTFSVAWYFFPEGQADQQKSRAAMTDRRMDKRDNPESMLLLDALRAVVWQLAEADATFQDFVVKVIEKNPQGMTKPHTIWTFLLNEYANSSKQDSGKPEKVLFLVLDGYGKMDPQKTTERKTFIQIIHDVTRHCRQRTQFRILLSGNQDFSDLYIQNISEISLSHDQRQDAKLFIEASLKRPAHEHWNPGSEGYQTLWKIGINLSFSFKGDYHELKECLEEVEHSSQRGLLDLQELQGENFKQKALITKRKLETLNNELESNEVEVLNELIVCMVLWKGWPRVPELNAYLTHRLGSKFKPPIEAQLNGKFLRLASVEDGFVYAENLKEFFNQTEVKLDTAARATDDKMCDHHHHRNGDDNVLGPKCMMDLLFAQLPADDGVPAERLKDWVKQHTIARHVVDFDRHTASLSIIKGFLQSICDNARQERAGSRDFFSFVAIFLPAHFSDVSVRDSLQPPEKQDLGKLLYPVFMDEKVVETWLPKGSIDDFLWKAWEKDVENVVEWLKDDEVKKGFHNAAIEFSRGPASTACHGFAGGQTVAAAGAFERSGAKPPTEADRSNTASTYDVAGAVNKSNIEVEEEGGEIMGSDDMKDTETAEEVPGKDNKVVAVVDSDGSRASDETSDSDCTESSEKLPDGNDRDDNDTVYLYELLQVPAKVVATQWLTESQWGASETFTFLIRILMTASALPTDLAYQSFDKNGITRERKPLEEKFLREKRFFDTLCRELDAKKPGLAHCVCGQGKKVTLSIESPDAVQAAEQLGPYLRDILEHPIQAEEVTDRGEPLSDDLEWDVITSPEAVKTAEKWVLSLLGTTEAQSNRSTTHDLRLAETFMGLSSEECFEEAERRYELIKAHRPLNIKEQLSLVHALDSCNRKRQALEELMKIRHDIQCAGFKEADEDTWTAELNRFWALCEITNSAKEAFTACHYLFEEFPKGRFVLSVAQYWIESQKKLDSSFEIISMRRRRDKRSLLSELFCLNARREKFHQKFQAAVTDRPRLVQETYEHAIDRSENLLDTEFLRYHYGVTLSRCGKWRDAMDAWEKSMDQFRDSKTWSESEPMTSKLLNQVAEALGSAYLGILLDPKRSESPKSYIEKLESYKARIDEKSPNGVNYLALLLSSAYLHMGQQQKAVASVAKHMSTAFSLLEDDREDNDWRGYFMLAEALNSLEDDDNARAAWSLIVNVPDQKRPCELSITCSGGCEWIWEGAEDLENDFYICKICPHVRFEGGCRELLNNDCLKKHICGANHKFLTVRRRKRSEVRTLEFNKVLVGKIEMNIDDWLDSLRQRYGYLRPQLGWPSRTADNLRIVRWRMHRQTGTLIKSTLVEGKKVLHVRK